MSEKQKETKTLKQIQLENPKHPFEGNIEWFNRIAKIWLQQKHDNVEKVNDMTYPEAEAIRIYIEQELIGEID